MFLIFLLVSGLVMFSRNYHFCSLCVESRQHCEYRELFRHLQYCTMDNQTLKLDVNLDHYVEEYIPPLPVIKLTFIENT
jgi:hypothetical protein